ncbi:type II toxin-antitoxin system VapC family toxin [Microbacterium sp. 2FI]|uniref:type II toxin-antitoxin system VapC family toxin n=1 Tax=Microbacterium sp. 2FI TaxID=2502193 RepID=UPI002017B926|nr:type II toxin-antitoxin system VapC family toxin [Microbacterium sp. 2FI]
MGDEAILIDSATAIYAMGESPEHRSAARAFLAGLLRGTVRAYASVEMVQEFTHHRFRRTGDPRVAAAEGRYVTSLVTTLNFDREVLDLSLELIERTGIRGRDAVHAATALAYGIETIASPDPAFDGIPGLRRVDPLAAG